MSWYLKCKHTVESTCGMGVVVQFMSIINSQTKWGNGEMGWLTLLQGGTNWIPRHLGHVHMGGLVPIMCATASSRQALSNRLQSILYEFLRSYQCDCQMDALCLAIYHTQFGHGLREHLTADFYASVVVMTLNTRYPLTWNPSYCRSIIRVNPLHSEGKFSCQGQPMF